MEQKRSSADSGRLGLVLGNGSGTNRAATRRLPLPPGGATVLALVSDVVELDEEGQQVDAVRDALGHFCYGISRRLPGGRTAPATSEKDPKSGAAPEARLPVEMRRLTPA
jgi:hypothetical protein